VVVAVELVAVGVVVAVQVVEAQAVAADVAAPLVVALADAKDVNVAAKVVVARDVAVAAVPRAMAHPARGAISLKT
jgi:hypothetical protein